jgi:hypothetical protein
MYESQVKVPYDKSGQSPIKRRPISTEVLMEVARIIKHGISELIDVSLAGEKVG